MVLAYNRGFQPHHKTTMRLLPQQPRARLFATSIAMTAALAACGGGSDAPTTPAPVVEATPLSLTLEKIGGYSTNQFGVSAAEIPAFDAASKRLFVVNAQLGAVDVLNLANPASPVKVGVLDATAVLAGAEINSVAVFNGIVAVAIQAPVKTDPGRMALYRASNLSLISSVTIGAQPDMITFTPDGNTVLVANEGEPSDDYQTDPEGSVSVIDVRNPATGEIFANAPDASAADLNAAVAAATRAFPAWRDLPIAERKACLVRAAELIEAHADELAALFVRAAWIGSLGGMLFMVGFAVLFAWQIGRVMRRNRPRTYTLDDVPRDLLP